MTAWKPTPQDIAWTQNLLDLLKDKGTWAVPCSNSMFLFDKTNKTFHLLGDPDEETNQRVIITLKELGYHSDANFQGANHEQANT